MVNKTPHIIHLGGASNRIAIDVEHYVGDFETTNLKSSRIFRGCQITELTLDFNAGDGALNYSVTLQGRGAEKALKPTTFVPDKTGALFAGWQGQSYLGFTGADNVTAAPAYKLLLLRRLTKPQLV